MKSKIKANLSVFIALLLALIHWIISFFTDHLIFQVPASANLPDYLICKILTLFAAFAVYYAITRILFTKDRRNDPVCRMFFRALPYLPVLIAVVCVKLPQGYLSNDEALIASSALQFQHYTWFYYLTTYFYIVCFMLIPVYLGPIFIKLLIELAVIGYVILRMEETFGKPYFYFGYALFLLYPVIAYTTSAHRLPVYFLLYLLFISVLLFDRMNEKSISIPKELALLLLTAILTQWRTEGIYLLILAPILMLFVYPRLRNKKQVLLLIVLSLFIQYLVSVPQNGLIAKEMDAAADDRMKPFYAYTITNMFRNGLDTEANAEDLAIVDRYLSLDKIREINDYYGDINYEDVLILYQEGYVGVREEADVTDFFNYAAALKRIFIHNPEVFLKTRIGAFCYAALPYRIETGNYIVSLAVSILKSVSYNLFLPLCIIAILWVYSLFRKRWFSFFLLSGVLSHWFIVFILAPASYFKYYFPVYITAYFYLLLLILQAAYKHFHATDTAIKKRVLI
ncbi:MAG: hypothetical protein IJU25_04540 [Lachnospiraceae bacterium]|nr:hypothetical protein [Lachnospiraceae bacterium]